MTKENLNILITSVECKNLIKVGGLGDVVYDLSNAIKSKKINISVIIPYYDIIKVKTKFIKKFNLVFGNSNYTIELYQTKINKLTIYLVKNKDFFSSDYGNVYIDSKTGPFEDDAKRFAFFSLSIVELLYQFDDFKNINVLHCHDWHTSSSILLLRFNDKYKKISEKIKTAFTIHNLDYQGERPLEDNNINNYKSFNSWYPEFYNKIKNDKNLIEKITKINKDKSVVFNPMKTGITLSDIVNTVSKTYAKEITKKDNSKINFVGGRGLEKILKDLYKQKKLIGILNGIDYRKISPKNSEIPYDYDIENWAEIRNQGKQYFLKNLKEKLYLLSKEDKKFLNFDIVKKWLDQYDFQKWENRILLVSVSRIVSQKMNIFVDKKVIEQLLNLNVSVIIFGTGSLSNEMNYFNNFENGLFIQAFDQKTADLLYSYGDMFLMPSDFEPCGISQMIALRYGCIPVVKDIGGLHETIQDNITGFKFSGKSIEEIKNNFLKKIEYAIDLFYNNREKWKEIQLKAMKKRFTWNKSAKKYIEMYLNLFNRANVDFF